MRLSVDGHWHNSSCYHALTFSVIFRLVCFTSGWRLPCQPLWLHTLWVRAFNFVLEKEITQGVFGGTTFLGAQNDVRCP